MEAEFFSEKETKNTVKYAEVAGNDRQMCGVIYLQKSALRTAFNGFPQRIKVTVTKED